jgi:hypothetical protein
MPAALATLAVGAYGVNRSNKSAKDAASASTQAASTQSDASLKAAEIAAQSQKEALDYYKQQMELPTQYRDQALSGLSSYYKTPGAPKTQQQLIAEAQNSPLYASIMGTQQSAVDGLARYASATGGLRSGNANVAFSREAQNVSQDALLQSYNQAQENDRYNSSMNLAGLSGLAGIDTGAGNIAGMMAGIGNTQAQGVYGAGTAQSQGQVAAAQARQQGTQNNMNNILGLGGIFAQMYGNGGVQI